MTQAPPRNPAETYESYFVPAMFRPWATILLRHAAPQAGARVLDVACGTGIVSRLAAPLVGDQGQVVGLDINPPMLAVARTRPVPLGAPISWQEGNAMNLPFPDGSFDLVLCQHGLQFFPDRPEAVREMHRVLVPGGRALAIVLQSLEKHPLFEALTQSVAHHLALPVAAVMTPFVLSDASELRRLFADAGFDKVDVIEETTLVRFPEPEMFVPLAVASSAAAVPAFAQLAAPQRAALLDAVRQDVDPLIHSFLDTEALTFPMYAHVAVATK